MKAYRLKIPSYTGAVRDSENPFDDEGETWFAPSMTCPNCGIWAGGNTIRLVDLTTDKIVSLKGKIHNCQKGKVIFTDYRDWPEVVAEIEHTLSLKPGTVRPGSMIGPPTGIITKVSDNDFLFPWSPFVIWVKKRVVDVFKEAGLSGVHYIPCQAEWAKKMKNKPKTPPEYWELHVTGHAWQVDSPNRKEEVICELCKRRKGGPKDIIVDWTTWDGSDFFILDKIDRMAFVTDKVRDIILENGFTNVDILPIPGVGEPKNIKEP